MAISVRASVAWAVVTADSTITLPTNAEGDRIYVFATWKAFGTTAQITSPVAWTEVTEFADGSVAAGAGTGSVKVGAWYLDRGAGAPGNPTLDWSVSPVPAARCAVTLAKDAGESWDDPTFATAAIAAATNWAATAAQALDIKDGAIVLELAGFRDDSATMTRSATTALEDDGSPDVTWNGNVVENPATHASSTSSNDIAADLIHRFVTTGASGVTLTATGTLSASETGAALWVHQSVTAAAPVTGTGAGTGAVPTGSGAGTVTFTGSGAGTGPVPTGSGTGTVPGVAGEFVKSFKRDTDGGTDIIVTVPAGGVAAGNTLVLGALSLIGAVTGVTDTQGNTWTLDRQQASGGNSRTTVASCRVATTLAEGNTITIALAESSTRGAAVVSEFAGLLDLDQVASTFGASTAADSGDTPTTTEPNEVVAGVIFVFSGAADTLTPGTGLTTRISAVHTNEIIYALDRTVSSTGAYKIDGSNSASRTWLALVCTYIIPTAGGGITGTGAGTGAAPTGAGSGKETFSAIGAGTGAAPTASGAGAEAFRATGAGTGAVPTGSGVGSETFTATGAGTGAAPTGTGAGTALLAITGTGEGVGAAPTGAGSGSVIENVTGVGAGTGAAPTGSGAGLLRFSASGAGVGAAPTGAGVGDLAFTGTGAGVVAAPSGAGTSALRFTGTGAGTGAASTSSGAGSLRFLIEGAGSGAAPSGSGDGIVTEAEGIVGVGNGVGPVPSGAGEGTIEILFTGSGAGLGTSPTGAGSGLLRVLGTGTGTGATPTGAGAGEVLDFSVTGSGAGVAAAPTGDGDGLLWFLGTGAGNGSVPTGDGLGSLRFLGTGAGTGAAPTGSGSQAAFVYLGTGAGLSAAPTGSGECWVIRPEDRRTARVSGSPSGPPVDDFSADYPPPSRPSLGGIVDG